MKLYCVKGRGALPRVGAEPGGAVVVTLPLADRTDAPRSKTDERKAMS